MIHQPLSPDGVHPPNQVVPGIVSPLSYSFGLVRYLLLSVYFFKELLSFIGSLDKYHISVFNALIITLSWSSNKVLFRVMGHIYI